MNRLFVRTRTWLCKDAQGGLRVQSMDGNYINKLANSFPVVTVASVVAEPLNFKFVASYRGQLAKHVEVIALKQTVQGHIFRRIYSQLINTIVITSAIRSATHVAVFMSSFTAVWAVFVAYLLKRPILVYSGNDWARDADIKYSHTITWLRKAAVFITDSLESLVLQLADVRLVNSPRLYEKCRRFGGISERVRPVSRFCLADAFPREDTCKGPIVRIVYPAAIIPRKNHATLLRAIAQLRGRGIEVELQLAGAFESDRMRSELTELAVSLGIADHVKFLGYVAGKDEMMTLLRDADAFVLPSLNEGFPRVVWEAMLQSLPCAVSRIPNIVADIGHRDVALMFDPLDPEDIATALHRIIRDGDIRRRLIRNGHAYACEVFAESWDQQIARVLREWI